jgi:hypothetical protein
VVRSAKWRPAIGVAAAVACALAIGGCSVTPTTDGSPDPALRGQWVLAAGSDTFGAIDLLGQDITLAITGNAISTGRNTCSDYTATIYGAERDLWVTTTAPATYNCATAEQSVLQLEYLLDLQRVRRSSVTSAGLELSAQGVDLRFVRAEPLNVEQLTNKTWKLATRATITLHSPQAFARETGGSIQFVSPDVIEARTICESMSANYRQVGDELVASDIRFFGSFPCDGSGSRAQAEFTQVFQNGFTFALTRNSLVLTSNRAGLALGFDEVGAG